MALIPGFEYDIFISYAHMDNETFPGQTDGWILQFFQNLNLMLAKRFGRMNMIKIWWDNKKLDGSVLFDESIEDGIKKSAIMICLNSPCYEESDYCKQELNLFHKKAQGEAHGLKIGRRSRLIHVLLNNINHRKWPESLAGTTGFPFHDANEAEDFGEPLETNSKKYRHQMRTLRDALHQLITDFVKMADVTQSRDTVAAGKYTIYLGEVADTLRSTRKRIIVELEKKGFQVITGIPPPDEAEAHQKATEKALQKSNLAVHLLDRYPGREIIGAPELWYPQKQTEISLQSSKDQMIWVPSEIDFSEIEEEVYKTFLTDLENGKVVKKPYEFVRGSKSTLANEIIMFAEQLQAKKVQKTTDKERLSVLLDTHFNDQLFALDLSKTLLENEIQPFINPQEDDPRKNINLLAERISQVRKLIFLYGNVSREWLLERMSAALQLIITRNYPIEDFFIYMAPPHKEIKDLSINQKFLNINIVDNSDQTILDKNTLHQFLNDLKSEVA